MSALKKKGFTLNLSITIVMTLFFINYSYGQEEVNYVNPHDFKNKELCIQCHRQDMPKISHDPVTTCSKCHQGNIDNHPVYRHPMKVLASRKVLIPEGFPLTRKGYMVCYTCHDYHNTTGMDKMLWIEYKDICISCHVSKVFRTK
jgi:predicted CXXCH cytochrome family protein